MSEPLLHYAYSPDPAANRGHRRFSLVIYLPAEIEGIVQPLRERFDPDCGIIPPHVSLVFPFVTELPLDDLSVLIREHVDRLTDIEVSLQELGDFYPDYPIIYWSLEESVALHEFCLSMHSHLGLPAPCKHFFPHVSIAREISNHRVMLVKEKIIPYIEPVSFRPQAVDLLAPAAGDNWVSVRTFVLPQ